MSTQLRLRIGAVAIVILAILIVGGAHLCDKAQDPGARPLGVGGLACTEFWLNRYQALISAAIAGSIAYWAGRLLLSQLSTQKLEFLARLARDIQDIYDLGHDLYGRCAGPLSPNKKIRFVGSPDDDGAFSFYFEIGAVEFSSAIKSTRECMIRLETMARRMSGPSLTAHRAQALAWSVAEFVRISELDAIPRGNLGMHYPGMVPIPLVERGDQSKEAFKAVSDAWRSLFEDGKKELDDLARRQAQAYDAVR